MELKQVVVSNGGMSRDLSVSKQDNKLAFENKNIRIQATDDGTLLSVTNLKNPKDLLGTSKIPMTLYGSCVTPEYLVLFGNNGSQDCIYRVTLSTLDSGSPVINKLYNGDLNFKPTSYFDTLYYEEGEKVKKVYWTDNINGPRVINLVTPIEREGGVLSVNQNGYSKNVFEFYPDAYETIVNGTLKTIVPKLNVTKNRSVTSELPAGVVQYFVSYYWLNGAETLIAASSDTYTIDYSTRGAKADEVGMCAFDIKIPSSTVNPNFDYIRVYSAVRTTYDGPLTVKIVGDIKINPDYTGNYTITDTGMNQEQLADGQLYFIGGTPFIAKTLTEKDNTLFLGDIKKDVNVEVPTNIANQIEEACTTTGLNGAEGTIDPENTDNIKWWSKNGILDFKLNKTIPTTPNAYNSYYPYKLQTDKGSSYYKTFKSGEIYRFGIQFQTNKGEWTTVVWIGDKECTERPVYDETTQTFKVNNVTFTMPSDVIKNVLKSAGYVNYRIVIADPEKHNGRKIKAQGILNPTLFTPGQRALNIPYALPSWIMRPRKGKAAYHHFEPIFSTEVEGAELGSYTPSKIESGAQPELAVNIGVDTVLPIEVPLRADRKVYTTPFEEYDDKHHGAKEYVVTCMSVSPGNQLRARTVRVWSNYVENNFYDYDGKEPTDYEVLCDYNANLMGVSNKFTTALTANKDTKRCVWTNEGTIYDNPNNKKGLLTVFEEQGLDERLVPSPELLEQISKGIEGEYAKVIGLWLTGAVIIAICIIITVFTCGAATPATVTISSAVLGATITFSSLAFAYMGLAICSLALIGLAIDVGIQIEGNKGIYKDDGGLLLSQDSLKYLLKEQYDDMTEYQRQLLARRFLPLYMTRASGCKYSRYINGHTVTTGLTSSATTFENIIFSSKRDKYTVKSSGGDGETQEQMTLPYIFRPTADMNVGNWDQVATYIQIFPVSPNSKYNKQVSEEYNNYYVDESWVSMNSPEIGDSPLFAETLKFRTIGTAPLTSNYADLDIQVNKYAAKIDTGIDYYHLYNTYRNVGSPYPLYSDYLYLDAGWEPAGEGAYQLSVGYPARHKIYMFSPNNYLGVKDTSELTQLYGGEVPATAEFPGIVKKQKIVNNNFSSNVEYFKDTDIADYGEVYYAETKEGEVLTPIKTNLGRVNYSPQYQQAILKDKMAHHSIGIEDSDSFNKVSPGNVALNFASTPHVLLNLQKKDNNGQRSLLPSFFSHYLYIFYGTTSSQPRNIATDLEYNVLTDCYAMPDPDAIDPADKVYVGWKGTRLSTSASPYSTGIIPKNSYDFQQRRDGFIAKYGDKNISEINYVENGDGGYAILVDVVLNSTDQYRRSSDLKKYVWGDVTQEEFQELAPFTTFGAGGDYPLDNEHIEHQKRAARYVDYINGVDPLPDISEYTTYNGESFGALSLFNIMALITATSLAMKADPNANLDTGAFPETHTTRGEWKQNAVEAKESSAVWDSNEKYHCGAYFIVDDNPFTPTSDGQQEFDDYEYSLNNAIDEGGELVHSNVWQNKIQNPALKGILLSAVLTKYFDYDTYTFKPGFVSGNTYTIDLTDSELSGIQKIVMGSYHIEDTGSNYKVSALQRYLKTFDIVPTLVGGKLTGLVFSNFVLNTQDLPSDSDIYLPELSATSQRFTCPVTQYEKIFPSGTAIENLLPFVNYTDFSIKYNSPVVMESSEPENPYLFIGEIYQDIPHKTLYGGTDQHNLRLLSWYPVSKATPIDENITVMEGDTYYQRWDCLKTYPITEEDVNQVVDITSFMVETHKNLDGRCDINRASFILDARPTNFNLFNPVYNQPNNIFEYATDWSDLDSSYVPNRITWSLTKNLFGDVDTWTNVTLENSTRAKYPVTKLVNWNNQVLALTEHSLELVNFNAKNLIPSTDNSFIELQNSGKVDGTTKLQNPYGTYNMSTLITEQGFYFIDDNEKSLIRISGEGPKKIGITKLTDWFHNNIIQGTPTNANRLPLHLEYDNIHKDIYLKNEEYCLVYNELLDEFTSFITYSGDYWLFNYGGNFYAYRLTPSNNQIEIHKMFAGSSYNKDFGEGSNLEYSVSYAINPNSYSDKVFTNGILAADLGTTGTDVTEETPNNTKDTALDEKDFPFNSVRAWTEYQDTGVIPFEKILDTPSNLKQKFRFWKFIIPRDAKTNVWPRNRIRNPWMRIKLFGDSNRKMEFHNMTIQYME